VYYAKPTPPGYGVLYCRYRVNTGRVGEPSRESVPRWLDIWDDGVFRTAQNGARAIVAYGLSPRGQRPISSLRLDIRLLGVEERDALGVMHADIGEPIVITSAETYIGVIPLEPTQLGHGPSVVVWRDGEETVISMVNYEGPPKIFWEYRSLAGPFCKGNVRNGFALWVAPRRDFSTAVEFREAVTLLPLVDTTTDGVRRIEWGEGAEQVTLEYDLKDLK
jgi:hypothetical protein